MQHVFGLIGYPLAQSFSQQYFREKFSQLGIADQYDYLTFPIESIIAFPSLLAQYSNLKGINVTIPYKEQVLAYVQHQHHTVAACGAANCLHIQQGVITAYNTDVIGFGHSLQPLLQAQHTQALILGTGGASKAVAYVLKQLGISYKLVSRSAAHGQLSYTQLNANILNSHKLIINTTPAGMYPNIDQYPALPYEYLSTQHLCYDLIYKPEETLFLTKSKQYGAAIKNGFEMLIGQAEASWDIWNGKTPA